MIKIGYNNSEKHYGDETHYEKSERTIYCIENLKSIYPKKYFIDIITDQTNYLELKNQAIKLLNEVHSENYVKKIECFKTNFVICRNCSRHNKLKMHKTFNDFNDINIICTGCDIIFDYDNIYTYSSIDTYFTPYTFDIAVESIIVLNKLLEEMKSNILSIVNPSSFAVIRPPGHHCCNDPNGFCIFNNVFVAGKKAQQLEFNKVLILDVDFHHGDGTQKLIEQDSDPNLSFISIHGYGRNIYPGTGYSSSEDDNILNIPILMDTSIESRLYITDEYYQNILINKAFPFINQQNPDLIIISLGFDAHKDDPLEGMNITDDTYIFLAKELKKLNKPLLFVLEGGYNVETISNLTTKIISVFE